MPEATILLVEDNKAQAKKVKDFLKRQGYEVIWVENGTSAIKTAKTESVDLILLDLVLPDLSGTEICRWLKSNSDTRGIPIIMLTAKGSVTDKVTGLEAGADDYLPKPYSEVELNARIYACLRTKALQDELREKNRQLEELLAKVELLAITDPLTGLYNRRHFENVLAKEVRRAVRYGSSLACMMIDIDHFKKINDEYGHHAGDQVLKNVAQILEDNVRGIDTVARWGGEEFIIILPHIKKEDAMQPAARIKEAVAQHTFPELSGKKVTVSIGIASVPDPSIDNEEKLINAADFAMYEAKNKGRNRIEIAR
jgi:diguanylate cyclase (GGDEF)-like protein